MAALLKLISHKLCPYVQRAVIALTEKGIEFERIDIDLGNKPEWFLAISPLGKTPVLQVGDVPIFESAVILEYLEETAPKPLHPLDPLRRRSIAGGSISDRLSSTISEVFTRQRTKRHSPQRRYSWSSVSRGWRGVSPPHPGSTKKCFRWWTRCTARCFGTSTCSIKSPILEFSPTSRSWRAGASRSCEGHRCAVP